MTTQNTEREAPGKGRSRGENELQPPHCPHCDKPMGAVGLFQWAVEPWLILEVHCPACWKSLHFTVVPMQVHAAPPDASPPKPKLVF